jgi:putative DNA primase/helicase
VETRNKKCIEKFKDRTDLKTYEQVQALPEFAGILADDVILIDIDDAEEAEILMDIVEEKQLNCRVYQTTRGKHFLFKNNGIDKNGTKKKLACGLTADIKIGSRNSYSVLKFNNEERFIEWDIEPGAEYQKLPKWLFPVNSNMDFLNMNAGDGRNQALFNYILTLQSNDFTVEEARETIRIINKHVLKVPLSDSELEVILRDDAFKKPIFFKGTTFLFDKFATYIKNNHRIIKINNQLHIYKDGVYVDGQFEIEAEMIRHISNLNRAKRNEVMSYLNLLIRDNTQPSDANLIAFKNGIYNIITDEFLPFSPEIIITNKINWDYNPAANKTDGAKLVDNTLNKIACHDKQIRMLLEEAIGYCLYRRNELGKAFILIGDRSNGKSTFLDMVKTMLGDENIASLDLGELGDRFKTAELFGKLANIGDDIGDEFIANASVFKKLVTGDRISVERKGQDPFEFNNYSKMLFSANNIPRIKDKTGAVQRRLTIIPFDAKFSVDDPDYRPYIKYELREQECIEHLILLALEGLKRVLLNQKFTSSTRVEQELEEYEESNNPIIGFFKEIGLDEVENEPTRDVYKRYQVYCSENNLQPLSNIEFSKQVKKKFDFDIIDKKIDGKKYRIFVRKEG